MVHCQAVKEAEEQLPVGRRTPGIQRAIEAIIGAAVAARKKDPAQTDWSPPSSVSMYRPSNKADIRSARAVEQRLIQLPGQ